MQVFISHEGKKQIISTWPKHTSRPAQKALVSKNSKPDLILHCSLLSILHKEMEDGELSKGLKLQHINEYLNVGLPGGSALLLEPLEFSTLQCILYF